MILQQLVRQQAQRTPEALAVRAADGELTYGALDAEANRIARALGELGVRPKDRVALWQEKSTRTVAAMQGILRAGAAYVPLDPLSPVLRAQGLVRDCGVRAVVTTAARAETLLVGDIAGVPRLTSDGPDWAAMQRLPTTPVGVADPTPGDLAYILYTSGSTGKPKGVCISHTNAYAFVEWGAREVGLRATDRLSNHAPFHFDLSVFDLYGAFISGGAVSIIPEGAAYQPLRLVEFLVKEKITVWYSVPSALILMMEHGRLFEADASALRVLIFAGEVFPIKHLRNLRAHWPTPGFWNWYGPTETNVCTSYQVVGPVPEERTAPVPVGSASCGDRCWAVRPDGSEAPVGEEGELYVDGPTVMLGYFGQPPQQGPYHTGDIVKPGADGNFIYVGRRDHMVKVRGHRIELGEIEAALLAHPQIRDAAVVVGGAGTEARLVAYLVSESQISLLSIKQHLSQRLPRYMIIDEAQWRTALPRTGNGKIDRTTLAAEASAARGAQGT